MQQPKLYTPGIVTAFAEFILGATCPAYLISFCSAVWWEYLVAVVPCFAFMQSRLTKLVEIRYREFPKLMRARIKGLQGR